MADMVNLTIDGHEVSVPKGTTILEAAKTIGTEVPHYCYHPGMSSPAMCRLCLVDVEGAPKPMPGCVTTVMDGQVVHTQSEQALKNRRGVLEFYLVNHPLDCPICDMSGECNLQDYVHAEGREHGRGREPKRIFGRDDFGGDVLFYGDRCVMCTRCVRFMSEVEQDHRLTVVERGNRSVIDTFFEEGLDGTHWHGNIVDICPVGALVSKEFLHKARAWDLTHTPSICTSCSQGCNVELHTRDNLVQRIKPSQAMGWGDALRALLEKADGAGSVKAVASPMSSNEDLGALRSLVDMLGGGDIVYRSARAEDEVPLKGFPGLVRRRDLTPNATGAELVGASRVGGDDASGGLEGVAGHQGIVIVLNDDLADQDEGFGSDAALFVYMGSHDSTAASRADFVLPISTHAEGEGTFTNHERRVQRFSKALDAPGMARPAWLVLGALAAEKKGAGNAPRSAAEAFGALGSAVSSFAGITWDDVGARGAVLNESVSVTGD
jgi:NADH-quinone oxidoreductase subunit G